MKKNADKLINISQDSCNSVQLTLQTISKFASFFLSRVAHEVFITVRWSRYHMKQHFELISDVIIVTMCTQLCVHLHRHYSLRRYETHHKKDQTWSSVCNDASHIYPVFVDIEVIML